MSAQTLVQKLFARAAGGLPATTGEVLTCRVDLVLADGEALRPGPRAEPHPGLLRPGLFCVGSDPRLAEGGAVGAFVSVVNADELGEVVASGTRRLAVPATRFMRWSGLLADGVGAEDMMLTTLARFGPGGLRGLTLEYCGEAVHALPMTQRMTLCRMSADLGACAGLVAPDDGTRRWLHGLGGRGVDVEAWFSDEDAGGERHLFDASTLAPQVGLPDRVGAVRSVDDLEPTRIDLAVLGAGAGACYEDLRAAARVLAGYRIADGVRLLVAPAVTAGVNAPEVAGILRLLREAGATVLPRPDGGAALANGARAICATSRDDLASRGSASARVYIGSPFTVAASALCGRIADARELLG